MAILFFLNTSNYRQPSQRQQWCNGKTGQDLSKTKKCFMEFYTTDIKL